MDLNDALGIDAKGGRHKNLVFREEVEVTGEPGGQFPSFRFVFGTPNEHNKEGTPEERAFNFVKVVNRSRNPWKSGPFLRKRYVVETDWEPFGEPSEPRDG